MLNNAILNEANLKNVKLTKASLNNAVLTDAKLKDIKLGENPFILTE